MSAQHWNAPGRYRLALAATVALFAIWGVAWPINNYLSPQFAGYFRLDAAQTALTLSLMGAAYFAFAIPSALLLRRIGFKHGVLLGLGSFSCGALLIFPAIARHDFAFFAAAVTVVGIGYSMLETSTNPLIMLMGAKRTSVLRLNFAQAFYPVGLLAGVYATHLLMLSNRNLSIPQMEQAASRPYLMIGLVLILLAFVVENVEFPRQALEHDDPHGSMLQDFRSLLARPAFRLGLMAMAACIAAQTCLWATTARFVGERTAELGVTPGDVMLWTWIVYGIGRFAGTALMLRFKPEYVLAIAAAVCFVLVAAAGLAGGLFGLICLVATSFFISIMFPTIFGNVAEGLGPLTKSASGLLVTASGFGANAVNVWMILNKDVPLSHAAAVVCVLFVAVLAFALVDRKSAKAETDEASIHTPARA